MLALVLLAASVAGGQTESRSLVATVDHLVYATPDLQRGSIGSNSCWAFAPRRAGSTRGAARGTRSSRSAGVYLEIIGPDPEQPRPPQARPFGIDGLEAPRLVAWAAKGTALEPFAGTAAQRGVILGPVISGSRRRADGVMLTWRYTDPRTVVADGLVPFFIDWGSTPHPAASAATGAALVTLRAEHPDAAQVQRALGQVGIELPVRPGPRAALIAVIDSPLGRVELR